MVGTLRTSSLARAALLVVLVAAGVFGWWTISPLFLTTTLHENLPAPGTATLAPTASAAATTAPSATPAGPKVLATGQLQRVDDLHRGTGAVSLVELDGKTFVRFENVDDPPQPAVVTARSAAAVIARALAGKAGNPGASYNEACSVAVAASTSPAVKTNDEPAERPHTMIVSRSVAQSKSVV